MDIKAFLNEYTGDLRGKTLVLTGASGGLGRELCRYLAPLGGRLILINHSPEKAERLKAELKALAPEAEIQCFSADFENCSEVKALCRRLEEYDIDFLVHNAGNYYMPRRKSAAGVDVVFQINFLSPYYITKELMPKLKSRGGRVVITGSIAHKMVRALKEDVDYSSCNMPEAVYGNSKRYLMYAHRELLRDSGIKLAVAHPGISPTGITDNYPDFIKKITGPSMKLLFMHPEKACLSILKAIFETVPSGAWIGPEHFDIWGRPAVKALQGCEAEERKLIFESAENLYGKMKELQ